MKIGNVEIGNGIFLAPMEDVSDLPFRVICKKLGADIVSVSFLIELSFLDGRNKINHSNINSIITY